MKILVIGGTGRIGSKVVERLRAAGHDIVVAAPSTGIDVLTGEGLDAAMNGAAVVVDLANSPSFEDAAVLSFFVTAGHNILSAAARAGVRHHVALSVVGTDKLAASGYFRGKIAQERLIRDSGLPYTIIHSTQFFEFLPGIIQSAGNGTTLHLPTAEVQPIAAEDVADAVARIAQQPPANVVVEIAGPERASMAALAQRFLQLTGDPRQVVADAQALYFGAPLQADTLIPAGQAWTGQVGFDTWLQQSGLLQQQPA
ncbi:TPA: SDR family oxidoreductase [Stenotrophomonas maltophilia]|uniref:SDR family oxidoreductase n=1 Tax=Stenotrophomonas maltophilia TaxID=40324 RepID=UPI0015DE4807|nr:SDR family oxidoreductase [Stenotrophomonas maltophilia]MBA0446521.1 SDR family oxidoreductase [Stenotrophomonas maltophilia]HEL2977294.1 SDR family oxidoreductase [Stenotrophomonas maltophilia]